MIRVPGACYSGLAFGVIVLGLHFGPAKAVENQTVERFVQLSAQFHRQLPNSRVASFNGDQQRERAVCILTRFERSFGDAGVGALMGLMSVLSKGAEFDDATIVAFNDRFGPQYDQIVRRCTNAVGA